MRPVGSTLTSPRSGEPDGPGGDEPAVEGAQDLVDLRRGAGQPRHHLGGGEPQHRGDLGVVGERRSTASGVPAGWPAAPRPVPGPALRPRRRRRGRRCRPRPGRAPGAGRAPSARRRTAGGPAGSPAPGRARPRPVGAWPRTCSPSRIWASLISHSQPSTCSSMSSNASSSGRSARPEVVVHLRRRASASRSAGGWRAAWPGPARRCWRARRAAAPAGRCRRRSRRGPSAG